MCCQTLGTLLTPYSAHVTVKMVSVPEVPPKTMSSWRVGDCPILFIFPNLLQGPDTYWGGRVDGWMENELMHGWMDGWMERRWMMDGLMNG